MTLDDAAAIAAGLPGVVVGTKWNKRTWMVGERGFAWQRPFSKADLKRYGDETPPSGEIFAVSVANLDEKDALLAIGLPGFFTIPHFNGFPAVLIELRLARTADVRAVIVDGWRTVATPELQAKLAAAKPARKKAKAKAKAKTKPRKRSR